MAGTICLQGGREFSSACRELDTEVLRRSPIGPVVVLAAAAQPGEQYLAASRNAARYYANLCGEAAVPAPDPRADLEACLAVLGDAALVVLPGGSPSELLRVLTELGDGRVGAALCELHAGGAVLSGASAGAMVLCTRTWLPDRDGGLADGLGLVPGLALPHHEAGQEGHPDTPQFPRELPLWGLPECGGVLVDGDGVIAAGAGTPILVEQGNPVVLSRTEPRPVP